MAYKNPILPVMSSFYTNLQVLDEPVYKVTADPNYDGNYVLIRPEGQTMIRSHSCWITTLVIIVEIVTKFNEVVDTVVCDTIDNAVNAAVLPGISTISISGGVNHNIADVTIGTSTYNTEYDGTNIWYTKATRYEVKVFQSF